MVSAILNDPERAEEIAETIVSREDEDDAELSAGQSVTGQTPVVTVLQDLADLVIAALGGKDRYPRPVTAVSEAVDELRTTRTMAAATDVIAALTPWALDDLDP